MTKKALDDEFGIRVLEVENIVFQGESLAVPVRVEIGGREYNAEISGGLPCGNVLDLSMKGLEELRLGDIPDLLALHFETDIGWLIVMRCSADLILRNTIQNWKGCVPIDKYYKLLKSMVIAHNFNLALYEEGEEDYYIYFGKTLGDDATIEDAYNIFRDFLFDDFVKELSRFMNADITLKKLDDIKSAKSWVVEKK